MAAYEQIDWTLEVSGEPKLTSTQRAVKELFEQKKNHEMTDRDLVEAYNRTVKRFDKNWPFQSPSGLRSRRDELTKMGIIVDTGRSQVYENESRSHTIWALK